MKLKDTFASTESRVYRTIMFVDMTESTSMKAQQPEASWLTTLGWFYDLINQEIKTSEQGTIIKFLGDGAMISYYEDHDAEAINAAIRIQESMAKGRQERQVDCLCSIGIAAGNVVSFQHSEAQPYYDYVGSVVDTASKLCSAASPQAIWVDRRAIDNALMRKIKSKIGEASNRTSSDYQGKLQVIPLKGFASPVEYYEILWHNQRYGIKSETVTETTPGNEPSKTEKPKVTMVEESDYNEGDIIISEDESLFRRGIDYWRRRDVNRALICLQTSSEMGNRKSIETIYQIGLIYLQEGDYDFALKLILYTANLGYPTAIRFINELQKK